MRIGVGDFFGGKKISLLLKKFDHLERAVLIEKAIDSFTAVDHVTFRIDRADDRKAVFLGNAVIVRTMARAKVDNTGTGIGSDIVIDTDRDRAILNRMMG